MCAQHEGVFVTVAMAVSTVSVIESIVVMRLCSLQETTMPDVVRFYAFRVVGRALWVTLSSSKHREDRGRNTERQDHPDDEEAAVGDTALSNVAKSSSELGDKVNDVLVELRKVELALFYFTCNQGLRLVLVQFFLCFPVYFFCNPDKSTVSGVTETSLNMMAIVLY